MSKVAVTIMGSIEVDLIDVTKAKSRDREEDLVEDNQERIRTAVESDLVGFLGKADWIYEEAAA